MTVMGDAFMEELSDRGSIPLRSIPVKPLKMRVIGQNVLIETAFSP